MNAIFSAQKLVRYCFRPIPPLFALKLPPQKVTIDACQIYGPETVFLQQAAHLTGGSYLRPERRDALLQYLLVSHRVCMQAATWLIEPTQMTFLSPPSIRKILAVPTQDRIDFRAACFCHKNIIDVGFVCSVCLSSMCLISCLSNTSDIYKSFASLFQYAVPAGTLSFDRSMLISANINFQNQVPNQNTPKAERPASANTLGRLR